MAIYPTEALTCRSPNGETASRFAFPPSWSKRSDLKEGDEIEIHVADGRQFGVARKPGRDALLNRLRAYRGRLPADFKFDRDEANARCPASSASG